VIGKIVLENIRHKFMRTLLSVLLIAVPVTLILVVVGLSHGIIEDSQRRARGVGADIVIKAPGSSLMNFSGATIPEQLVTKLASRPHVVMAMGTANQSTGGLFDFVTGIDPVAFDRMSGGFDYLAGRGLRQPDDILLDRSAAEQRHVHVNDTITVLNRRWHVAGIVEPGKLSHMFCDMKVLQDLIGARGMVSGIYLKVDDPKNVADVVASLKAEPYLKEYPVYPMEEFTALTSADKIPYLSSFIAVIVGISVVISFAVVALSMYMAVLQRTREIGILKAIGASKTFIVGLIVAESLLVGLGGTILGIIFSYGARTLLAKFVPSSLPQAIVVTWWPIAGGIVLGAALLGALYPGVSAARQDPIEALAYE
jgi:putative ABC transport system permease protein